MNYYSEVRISRIEIHSEMYCAPGYSSKKYAWHHAITPNHPGLYESSKNNLFYNRRYDWYHHSYMRHRKIVAQVRWSVLTEVERRPMYAIVKIDRCGDACRNNTG